MNYGFYGTYGAAAGDEPPADSIQIDITDVLDGTANSILFVNPDGTLGDDENFKYYGNFAGVGMNILSLTATAADNYAPTIVLNKYNTGNTTVTNGDKLATYAVLGYDGTDLENGFTMTVKVDGAVSTGVVPTGVEFATGSGDLSTTARMYINSSGQVAIGYGGLTNVPTGDAKLSVKSDGSTVNDIIVNFVNDSNVSIFRANGDATIDIDYDSAANFYPIYFARSNANYYASSSRNSSIIVGFDGTIYTSLAGVNKTYFRAGTDGSGNEAELTLAEVGILETSQAVIQGYSRRFRNNASVNVSDYTFQSQIAVTGNQNEFIINHTGASINVIRLGIGIANPITPTANANEPIIYSEDISAANAAIFIAAEGGQIYYFGTKFGLQSNHELTFYTNDTLRGSFSTDGNFTGKYGVAFDAVQAHTSGATVTIDDNIRALYVDPAASIDDLEITMPANPIDGQEILISFGGTLTSGTVVTNLTLSGNTSQTILAGDTITSAVAGDGFWVKWEDSTGLWRMF